MADYSMLNPKDVKQFLLDIIENNKVLVNQNIKPIAISITGEAGLGKTSVAEEVGESLKDYRVVIMRPQQSGEVTEFTGYPERQFEMVKKEINSDKRIVMKKVWANDNTNKFFLENGFNYTNKTRLGHAVPSWVNKDDRPIFLIIDDWTRAQPRFLNALMDLILTQKYQDWELPKGSFIVLTENPDNGVYSVQGIDKAQRSRFITIGMEFDVYAWAEWAERIGLPNKCINFILNTPEVMSIKEFKKDDNGDEDPEEMYEVNPRSVSMFFESIINLKEYKSKAATERINKCSSSLGPEFRSKFQMFMNNDLEKIPSPKEIFDSKDEVQTFQEIVNLLGSDEDYRNDIATILAVRLINYAVTQVDKGQFNKANMERFERLLINQNIFQADTRLFVTSKCITADLKNFRPLIKNPELQKLFFNTNI